MSNQVGSKANHRAERDEAAIIEITQGRDAEFWWPVERSRVLFVRSIEDCPVCRIMQSEGAGKFGGLLHVVATGDRLIVTEANNLHSAGRVMSGVTIADSVHGSTFQLSAEPPPGLDPARHLPASGIATLTWGSTARLQIVATAVGPAKSYELVVDAVG